MNCPIDGTQLVITERSGVEIDYCPQCRGIWLDRGELDKIIERAGSGRRPLLRAMTIVVRKKKRGGWDFDLGDLFDF